MLMMPRTHARTLTHFRRAPATRFCSCLYSLLLVAIIATVVLWAKLTCYFRSLPGTRSYSKRSMGGSSALSARDPPQATRHGCIITSMYAQQPPKILGTRNCQTTHNTTTKPQLSSTKQNRREHTTETVACTLVAAVAAAFVYDTVYNTIYLIFLLFFSALLSLSAAAAACARLTFTKVSHTIHQGGGVAVEQHSSKS